ncbi:hypothetical protein [Actinocrispum wychmicini]|uniref:Uncharacterized protein n=1 Tax=Actinocrispum wychmicini TaxID=1213861 RepID=A0A4R2IUP3_9PSEU|nr:hypothetical protein [Actinocrispum wychmicini]TCO48029.1 hypothetical protein EV192_11682 [Actinocrispum wychmicini]
MSWTDYYKRRDALDSVLVRAQRDPAGPLPRSDAFSGPAELLLALHYRWTLKLTGALGVALSSDQDPVDAVSAAWRRTATDNPTLHAVLSTHAARYPELRPMVDAEKRTLALAAGLAEPHEPVDEITRVGTAFEALLRTAASPAAGSPVEQLIRRLVASS